ncbi:hypothetical protein QCA50_017247 [Cerrena zonata]|uniref:Uncharacterized protein n=1 Tax=Cerrena zonata TaxID=2478898 RepID=A0AAW0FL75_9APHY
MEDEIPEEIPEEGGFLPEEEGGTPEEGGFIPEEEGGFIPEEGGFIPEEGGTPEEGGFIPEEDGDGGFVVDNNHHSKGTNEDTEDLSFLQTIPDTHFKEDENGELVYDPREGEETPEILDEASNEEISLKNGQSPILATEDTQPKGIPEEKAEEHQAEVTDELSKPKADAWLHDAPLPNAPDTQDQSPDEVTNLPNEPLPEPLPQPLAQPLSHESSGELPNESPGEQLPDEEDLDEQEQLDPEELAKIAQEENELGFEYSDSD